MAFIFYLISMIMFNLANNYAMVLLAVVLFGMGHGTNFPVVQVLLTRAVPFQFRAAFMSLNGTILRLGQSAGPVVMGLLYPFFGIKGLFIAGAAVALITGIMLYSGLHSDFGQTEKSSGL